MKQPIGLEEQLSFSLEGDGNLAEATDSPSNGEIVIAFVAAVGVNLDRAESEVEAKLIHFGYCHFAVKMHQ